MSNSEHKRLGILGGTFDPPHVAHLVLAEQARTQLGLEQVLFCPAGQQPLKSEQAVTPVEQRVAMVQLAIADQPCFGLSRLDIDRPGPHYTADLLALVQRQYPGYELYFLMGADSLGDILRWRNPDRIVAQAWLVVARRPGVELDEAALGKIRGLRERLIWLDTPWLDIAATDIRRRIQAGMSIRYLVPPAVEAYILQNKLYLA